MKKKYFSSKLTRVVALASLFSLDGLSQVEVNRDTLFYTGEMQQYTIPNCASSVVITTYGAQGANGATLVPSINSGGLAGLGNRVTGSWDNLLPGQTIYVQVGGAANGASGGYNGGGNGISVNVNYPSGGGGGATDIRFPSDDLSDRVQVAGGGGGGGNAAYHFSSGAFTGGNGGSGGGTTSSLDGGNGEDVLGDGGFTFPGGTGGSTSGPGSSSNGCSSFLGQDGGANFNNQGGEGGLGSTLLSPGDDYRAHGGAGGGGYVGGNGGGGGSAGNPNCSGNNISAGGGGSAGTNYFNGEPTVVESGVRSGHGMVVIEYSIVSEIASVSVSEVPCVGEDISLDFSPEGGTFSFIQGTNTDLSQDGVFSPSVEGTYEIVYAYTDPCSNVSSSDTLLMNVTCNTASLVENSNVFVIYPNPAESSLFIQSEMQLGAVHVYDMRGQRIAAYNIQSTVAEINVQNFEPGIYFIQLNDVTKKFTIK